MGKKLLFLTGILMLCLQTIRAQSIDVSGKVSDEKGTALYGISVEIKGRKTGTVTRQDGVFNLKSIPADAVLIFSGIGYESQSIAVANGPMSVVLKIDTRSMSEVVVTGVGIATSRKKVAIDVGSISSKDVAKSAIASVEQALQGKIAGASVQFTSGTPGTAAQIVLRGINDLSSTPPMILVDGVEVSGGLNGLDLSAVDRVEVVKGAAGGTLYGAQGANGVIQVFTKKGIRNRKPQIHISTQISTDEIIRENEIKNKFHHFVTDAQGFIIRNGVRIAPDVNGKWPDPSFITANLSGAALANAKNDKPYMERTQDHISDVYSKAFTYNTSLNISGGGERSDYSFAVSHLNQKNVLFNGYKRTNVSANLGFELFKGFSLRTTSQYIFTDDDLLNVATSRFSLVNSWQFVDFKFKGPTGVTVVKPKQENQLNPLSEREWHTTTQQQHRLLQSVVASYKFPRFLELDYKYGLEIRNIDLTNLYRNQQSAPQSAEGFWGTGVEGSINSLYSRFTYQNSLASAYLRFDLPNDFKLKIPLRSTTQISYDWRNAKNHQYFARGNSLPPYPPFNINVAQTKDAGSFDDEFITYGVLINQTFDYANLFGISAGIRSDYSSEFGDAADAFKFPRVTAYVRPSEHINIDWLTDWKIRAAYGEAGIQPVDPTALIQPGRYARQITLSAATIGNGGVGLTLPSQASNPLLKVQRSKELEIGTDITFKPAKGEWLSRVLVSGTYWKRTSEDIIQPADVPLSTGFQTTLDNLATLTSRGFDLSVDVDVVQKKNFTWNFGVRLGTFKVMVDKISNGKEVITGVFGLRVGEELGVFNTMYPIASIDAARPDKTPYIPVADRGFYEVVNNTVVDKRTHRVVMSDANDQKVMGKAYPKFNASFINGFTILQNLAVSFQFDWRQGNQIYNISRQWMYRDRLHKDFDKPVTINGQTGAFVEYYNSLYNSISPSSWFIEDGSFVRLRDLSLTYAIGDKIREKAKWLRTASITVAARNLVTFTKYSGLDPESTNTANAQGFQTVGLGVMTGVDYFGVPNLKSYQVSLSLGF